VIYQKTPHGIAEIAATEKTLNFRQRRALILVDGKRSAAEIGVYLNQANMPEILANLEALGHIVDTAKPSSPQIQPSPIESDPAKLAAFQAAASQREPALTEQQVHAVKTILINSTEQHLGIMGRSLKQKIEAAVTDEQIIACTSQWHMAMRDSKLGRELAGALMEQVQQLLMQTSA